MNNEVQSYCLVIVCNEICNSSINFDHWLIEFINSHAINAVNKLDKTQNFDFIKIRLTRLETT